MSPEPRPAMSPVPHDSSGARPIEVHEHLARILSTVRVREPVRRGLADAQGCVLAEDLVSLVDMPGFDNSAMDGYAVRAADVASANSATPVTLPVDGDVAAGDTRHRSLTPAHALRIMTGAPVPEGADTVVQVELTDGGLDAVRIDQARPAGANVRRRGEDITKGQVVLRAGTRLGPRQIALAVSAGHGQALVVPPPRVVVISTGDELVEAGTVPGHGQVVDSNGPMLAAAARDLGAVVTRVGGVPDDVDTLGAVFRDRLGGADAVITTGGVSMGAYDAVKEVLSRQGTVRFDRVAMQPGKPQGFGTLGPDEIPVFTLPGNPGSSMVSFEVFVAPALRCMAGRPPFETAPVVAEVEQGWRSPRDKTQFARVVVRRGDDGRLRVAPVGGQGSHVLGGLAQAHGLALVPAETTDVVEGAEVLVLGLDGTTPGGHLPALDQGASAGPTWFGAAAVSAAGSTT